MLTGLSEGHVISTATLSSPSANRKNREKSWWEAQCGSEEEKRTEASSLIVALFADVALRVWGSSATEEFCWEYLLYTAVLGVIVQCSWGQQVFCFIVFDWIRISCQLPDPLKKHNPAGHLEHILSPHPVNKLFV